MSIIVKCDKTSIILGLNKTEAHLFDPSSINTAFHFNYCAANKRFELGGKKLNIYIQEFTGITGKLFRKDVVIRSNLHHFYDKLREIPNT